jgi:DnaJ-domain-containing protein 1
METSGTTMNKWGEDLSERQRKLRQRVAEVQARVQDGLSYACDRLLTERMDTYFVLEERLQEFERLFLSIHQGIEETTELAGLKRLEDRFNYLEDYFEEVDSELRGRPARQRSRKFSFFNFFRQWQAEQEKAAQAISEIRDTAEAYQVLGLSVGSDLKTVTAAFRQLVKGLHPDTREGDRSTEPQLRKLMAAYQFIKREFRR